MKIYMDYIYYKLGVIMENKVIEKNGLRWYRFNDSLYPSVSTVLGWKKTLSLPPYKRKVGNAANLGTAVHYQVEKSIYDVFGIGDYYKDMPNINIWNESFYNVIERLNSSMNMWYSFLKNYPSFNPISTEMALHSKNNEFLHAGRIDIYAELENEKYLIDIKTGAYYDNYVAQLCGGYGRLLKMNNYPVDKIAILFLDSRIDRNPEKTYKFKIFTIDEVKQGEEMFDNKLFEYYNDWCSENSLLREALY